MHAALAMMIQWGNIHAFLFLILGFPFAWYIDGIHVLQKILEYLFPFLHSFLAFDPVASFPLELINPASPQDAFTNEMICKLTLFLDKFIGNLLLYLLSQLLIFIESIYKQRYFLPWY